MFKQFNKTLALIGATALLAMPALAQEPAAADDYEFQVGGQVAAYFGQYDNDVNRDGY